jgi:hypothetical protein
MRLLPHLLGARENIPNELNERQAKPPEEVVYRSLTIAAILLILISLWAF